MQNVTILGMVMQDRTVEEALSSSMRFLRSTALDIVAYVDFDTLLQADREEKVRVFLSQASMTLWSDKKLLELAGVGDDERVREVSENRFLRSQLRNVAESGGDVILAGIDEASIEKLRAELTTIEPGINILNYVLIDNPGDQIPEATINGINECAPAIIISRMDYLSLYKWLKQSKTMINAGIWLAIPEHMSLSGTKEKSIIKKVRRGLRYAILRRRTTR